jgi:GNAT superfamily N-acetyltransferase
MDGALAPLVIRDATPDDHAGLRTLYAATWPATYTATLGEAAVAAMLDDVAASEMRCMLPGQDERAAVAMAGGTLIGSAVAAEREGIAYLWGMYVHPAHQRRGIGATLLRHVAGWLTPSATIEARVLPSSPWAIAFYTRHGFAETGRERLEIAPGLIVDALLFTIPRQSLLDGTGSMPSDV